MLVYVFGLGIVLIFFGLVMLLSFFLTEVSVQKEITFEKYLYYGLTPFITGIGICYLSACLIVICNIFNL